MNKQDILNMNNSKDIMKTLTTHPDIWDNDINEHLKAIAKKENLEKFGSEDVLYTPPLRNGH